MAKHSLCTITSIPGAEPRLFSLHKCDDYHVSNALGLLSFSFNFRLHALHVRLIGSQSRILHVSIDIAVTTPFNEENPRHFQLPSTDTAVSIILEED